MFSARVERLPIGALYATARGLEPMIFGDQEPKKSILLFVCI